MNSRTNGARRRVILGVFAHPDDESFGPGGTLALYAGTGADVHVIIATDGIAGSVEAGTELRHDSLAQVRSAELADAAVALGLTSIWSLPYRDSGMRGSPDNDNPAALIQQPLEHLVVEMVDAIRRLKPDVIITHDPFGGYGHPDHIKVCEAMTTAFHATRGPEGPQKLYYTALDKRFLRLAAMLMPLWGMDPTALGRNKDINLVEIAGWQTPIHAAIDTRAWTDAKEAASRAHASQYSGGPGWVSLLPKPLRTYFVGREGFTRAWPVPSHKVERDLFEGLTI